jgi:Ser/Thr protein kinase RdoA (MazF antagonist)
MAYNQTDLIDIVSKFEIKEGVGAVEHFGMGHINDSYVVKSASDNQPGYLLQRINHHIFKDVPALMNNILLVTDHLKTKLKSVPGANPETEVLTVVKTKDHFSYHHDSLGNYWRVYTYLKNTKSLDIVVNTKQAQECGKALGKFQAMLTDFDTGRLHETIPNFHNVASRLSQYHTALERNQVARKQLVVEEMGFISERIERMCAMLTLAKEEHLPVRVTHNDTKFNNVLLNQWDRAQCIVDLDTVMPGYVSYDFGDAIRTLINMAAEDEPDLVKIGLNMPIFEAFTKGYLTESVEWLTEGEIKSLSLSVLLFPYMQGVRFLTDYLQGDTYYKTQFPDHNLQRARAQFQLVRKLEEQYEMIEDIIWETANRCLDLTYERSKPGNV